MWAFSSETKSNVDLNREYFLIYIDVVWFLEVNYIEIYSQEC